MWQFLNPTLSIPYKGSRRACLTGILQLKYYTTRRECRFSLWSTQTGYALSTVAQPVT